MPDYQLVPVDHDPFGFVPVDHDPFAADQTAALASTMTHHPSAPDPAAPYLRDVENFASGGLYGVLKGRGIDLPQWADRIADVAQDPAAETALGMATGLRPRGFWTEGGEGLRALRQALADNKSLTTIAREHGVSVPFLSRVLKTNNLQPARPLWSKIDFDKVEQLRQQGKSWQKIADELGTTAPNIFEGAKLRGLTESAGKIEGELPSPSVSEWVTLPDGTMVRSVEHDPFKAQ